MNKLHTKFTLKSKKVEHGGKRVKNFKRELKSKPLISIITVVKNNDKYLNETFKSVFAQDLAVLCRRLGSKDLPYNRSRKKNPKRRRRENQQKLQNIEKT